MKPLTRVPKEEAAVKKFLALAIVALVVPSVALAAKPNPPGNSQNSNSKAAPKALYILKGILTSYTAAPPATTCPSSGSVTITLKRTNLHQAAFKTLTGPLVVCVSPTTRLVVKGGGTLTTGSLNNYGVVKVRYPKKFDPTNSTELAAFLGTGAKQVIVKKTVPSS
jgi:hypothetical protein